VNQSWKMSERKTTTSITVEKGKNKVTTSRTTVEPKFPYGCKYCGRENVTSAPGNSCGRSSCNEEWHKERDGDSALRKFGTLFGIKRSG